MIVLRAKERGVTNLEWLESYHTFSFGDYLNRDFMGFHSLRVINDDIIAPSSGFDTHPHRDMEIITIMLSGELTHTDSLGNSRKLKTGEVQVMTAGRGVYHSEHNASSTTPAHLIQTWILPREKGLAPHYDQREFTALNTSNSLIKVATGTPEDQSGALPINQDGEIYMGSLSKGETISIPNSQKLPLWIHITSGDIAIGDTTLLTGDGVGIESGIDITAQGNERLSTFLVFIIP